MRVPGSLSSLVDAFWRFEGPGQRSCIRILPDGCMDFVFDLNSGSADVVGSMTRAELIAPPTGARYFGVRFLPGVAALLIDARANELTDRTFDLSSLLRRWPKRSLRSSFMPTSLR